MFGLKTLITNLNGHCLFDASRKTQTEGIIILHEDEIKKLSENFLIITTKSNFKKALTKLGVDAQHIIVAGVPLQAEDMKLINPRIPDAALKSVGKKIEHDPQTEILLLLHLN